MTIKLYHVDIRRDGSDIMTASALASYLTAHASGTVNVPDFTPAPSLEMRLTIAGGDSFNYAAVTYGGMTFYYFVEPVAFDFAPLVAGGSQFSQTHRFTLDVPHTFAINSDVAMRGGTLLTRSHALGEYDNFTTHFHGIPETVNGFGFHNATVYSLQDENMTAAEFGKFRVLLHFTAKDSTNDNHAVDYIMTPDLLFSPRDLMVTLVNTLAFCEKLVIDDGTPKSYDAPQLVDAWALPASFARSLVTSDEAYFTNSAHSGTKYLDGDVVGLCTLHGFLKCFSHSGVLANGTTFQGSAFRLGNRNISIEHGAVPLNPYDSMTYSVVIYPKIGGVMVSVGYGDEKLDLTESCRLSLVSSDAVANRLTSLQNVLAFGSSALDVGKSIAGAVAGAPGGLYRSFAGAVESYMARKARSAARVVLSGGFLAGSQPPGTYVTNIDEGVELGGVSVAYFIKCDGDPNIADEKHLYGYSSAPVPPPSSAFIRGYNYTYYEGDVRVTFPTVGAGLRDSITNFRLLYRDELERILSSGCRIWETATGYGNADGRVILH